MRVKYLMIMRDVRVKYLMIMRGGCEGLLSDDNER